MSSMQMQMRAEDRYPSRVEAKPQILKRTCPVVHDGITEGPLTKDQIEGYRKNGYLFLEGFFSEERVTEMREELLKVLEDSKGSSRPEVILEPDSDEVRSVFAIHRDNEVFKALAKDKLLRQAVKQLLGSEIYVHQSRINFKKGFTGKEFYWHSDFETWHVEDGMPLMRALSCSLALEDNYSFNGPLMVMPGSQNHYISCVGETPEENYKNSLRKQVYGTPDHKSLKWLVDEFGIDTPVGKKGSITLFDCNIMHGSNSNITPFPRSNVFMVFNSVENELTDPFSGGKPRPEYIGHRETLI